MEMQEALDRCEFAIRHQQEEIARLRAVVERQDEELTQLLAWINGDSDALTVLQRTYMDPRISTSDRIKACGAAIGYERYKLTLAVSARSSDVLGDCLDAATARDFGVPPTSIPTLQGNSRSSCSRASRLIMHGWTAWTPYDFYRR